MKFTQLAAMPTPRDYHSTALLMPDGRVWVGGGGDCGACPDDSGIEDPSANHPDFEIYTPPYLYAPDGSLAVRPVITSAPASLTLGNALTVSASANVTSFGLVRMGTSTHSLDTDQRRVPLTIQSVVNGTYTLAVPGDPGITVPGYWMLFALDARGVPSVSAIIQIGTAPTATAIAATGDFNGDGNADILWQNDDGTPAIWLMNGTSFIGGGIAGDSPSVSSPTAAVSSATVGSDSMQFISDASAGATRTPPLDKMTLCSPPMPPETAPSTGLIRAKT